MQIPGNLSELFKKAQEMQGKLSTMAEEAEKIEIDASAGGGMVSVRVNGKCQLCSIKIDPTVVNPEDVQMLEDLVKAAVNEGMRKAKDALKTELSKLTGGLPIPGFS